MKNRIVLLSVLLALSCAACGTSGDNVNDSISSNTSINAVSNDSGNAAINVESNDSITTEENSSENADASLELEDGTYKVGITMEGGTGKAYIQSPAELTVEDGHGKMVLVWSSKNYDYMIVNDIKYLNENEGGESTFTIPVDNISDKLNVIGDTVAMSTPHEIEYVLSFNLE